MWFVTWRDKIISSNENAFWKPTSWVWIFQPLRILVDCCMIILWYWYRSHAALINIVSSNLHRPFHFLGLFKFKQRIKFLIWKPQGPGSRTWRPRVYVRCRPYQTRSSKSTKKRQIVQTFLENSIIHLELAFSSSFLVFLGEGLLRHSNSADPLSKIWVQLYVPLK